MHPILPHPLAWIRCFHALASSLAALFTILGSATIEAAKSAKGSSTATSELRQSLTFHASFDRGLDADFAKGDPRLYHIPNMKRPRIPIPGLPTNGLITLDLSNGRFGNALRFTKKASEVPLFQAAKNVHYKPSGSWSGTFSLWLKVDPASDLAPSFCDPLQITPREWNDAAFFVEFEKKPDLIPFRLGAYPDFAVWNERNRKWEDIPAEEKPLAGVLKPPFQGNRWTHVVFTFDHFNTSRDDGVARLYLDAKLSAVISPRKQTFTWNPDETLMMLGVGYIGLWDELSVFDRALSEIEVRLLHELPRGPAGLLR